MVIDMVEERRLKDYKGYQVWRCVDDSGKEKEVFYLLNTQDGDNVNVYKTLKELKADA